MTKKQAATNKPDLTPEQKLRHDVDFYHVDFYQRRNEHVKQVIHDNLMYSIKTMREFLDSAEHLVQDQTLSDYNKLDSKVNAVIHALGWGQGNASTSLQDAIRYLAEFKELQSKLEMIKQLRPDLLEQQISTTE